MIDNTIVVQPENVISQENMAFILAEKGTLDLIELMNAAELLSKSNRKDDAITLYRLWLEHSSSPMSYVAYFNLGVLLVAKKEFEQGVNMYRKAIELNANFLQASINLGSCFEQMGQEDKAIEQWRTVLQMKSIIHTDNRTLYLHTLNNLGRLLESKRQFKDAHEMLGKSFALDTSQHDVLFHLAHLTQKMCSWPIYTPPKGITTAEMIRLSSPLSLIAAFDDPELQLTSAKRFIESKYSALAGKEVLAPKERYNHNKIRIGYLSSDLSTHAVSIMIVELLELHDRERFEVYGFCWSREDGTAFRNRVINALDHHIQIGDMSDKQAAECIRSHEIDILIDLHGLTSGARPIILSYRPAPVQITYLGFAGTTGLPWLDFIIADKYLIPDELAQFFSEKPLYMPNCFQVSDRKREIASKPTRSQYNLPEDAFVFCAFNNNYKITPELFAVWMKILKRVPGSVLWLLIDNDWSRENLSKVAKKLGIKSNRIVYAERALPPEHLSRYQLADLFLDTYPCNGGTTANEALWMGLPLLTLSGRTIASRMAGSLLTNLGIPELITTEMRDYEEKAVYLAKNSANLEKIRKKLENRASSNVFDIPQLARDIENIYIQALGPNIKRNFENMDSQIAMENKIVIGGGYIDNESSIRLNGNFESCVQSIILKASFMKSLAIETKLPKTIRNMPGMSGRKYRYLINNLVEYTQNARYLEIGSWAGSTACSAMYGNRVKTLCIDNWSEFGGPKDVFLQNMEVIKTTAAIEFAFLESDFRKVDYSGIGTFNIFLFDGPHSEEDQYDGVSLTKSALDDVYTFIIDDWNWERVRHGTLKAIQNNGIEIICSIEIRTTQDNTQPVISMQQSDWHNGYFIAVCRKK